MSIDPIRSEDADCPLVLVVDDEWISRDFASRVLRAAEWRVAAVGDGESALRAVTDVPALVLMDLQMDGLSGQDTTAAIRALPPPAASVPILAYTTARNDLDALRLAGFDGFVAKPCTPAELAVAAAHWRPDGAAAALDRLESRFGAGSIDGMVIRLRDLMAEAVAIVDDDGDAIAIAHRLAGSAGTLGFADAGRAWLALSEGGGDDAIEAVRRESRRVIATIDRRHAALNAARR